MFVWCDHCKRQFEKYEIRKCPYSKKGKSVCFWCCKGCRFVEWDGCFQKCGYLKTICDQCGNEIFREIPKAEYDSLFSQKEDKT